MVLCDTEEEYTQRMSEFLKGHQTIFGDIRIYTNVQGLQNFMNNNSVEILVIAENVYMQENKIITEIEEMKIIDPNRIILLNESGIIKWDHLKNVDKYQAADNVFREILQEYAESVEISYPRLNRTCGTRLIGMYSPVRRCLQTSFALTLGQMLAQKHKTLYLNLEHYAGISEILPDMQTRDLGDLLFFLLGDSDKFTIRMQTIVQKKGNLDYIPPMRIGQNLLAITLEEWENLLYQIVEWGEYKYVILDLTENIQGLLEILRMCNKVFTLTKEDEIAKAKVAQYEHVLQLYKYEDVIQKTLKYNIPLFRRLPTQLEQYTKGELAEYVKTIVEELFP